MRSNSLLLRIRSGPLVLRIVSVVSVMISLTVLLPVSSPAAGITGDSTTYLQSKKAADGANQLPLYEYLNFSVQDAGKEQFSFHFGGWVRYDMKDKSAASEDASKWGNDLQYAFLSYRSKNANSLVNLGRVMVFEGVAAERVDGIYAKTDLARNFGVSVFGGAPVETGDNLPSNSIIYGARVSHQTPGLYRLGVSYLKENKDSKDFREEAGIDLWLKPVNKVELMGNSRFNSITSDWANHSYFLVLGPFEKVRFSTEASLINYKDYFSGTTMSAFNFQPSAATGNEKARILGEEAAFDLTDTLSASVNFKSYTYEIAGDAAYAGGSIRYANAKSAGAGLSIHRMDGSEDRLKYTECRIYGHKQFGHADLTLDLLDVNYAQEINGVKDAYSLSLAAAYELTRQLQLGADMEYSKTPDFDKDFRTFFKVIYRFDTGTGTGKEGA